MRRPGSLALALSDTSGLFGSESRPGQQRENGNVVADLQGESQREARGGLREASGGLREARGDLSKARGGLSEAREGLRESREASKALTPKAMGRELG